MRTTTIAAITSALTAAALVLGAGTSAAEDAVPPGTPDEPNCVVIETFAGAKRIMCLTPQMDGAPSSLGYGSFGTGSLAGLLSGIINAGSVALSVDLPNLTGSYAPGSLGSYGPEASIGQVLTGSVGSAGGAS
ncbi:hypothetical protein [Dietzia alimentaria]|uniref:hypothetical protein n=1 Tax=Dietzia alimentaria TaxID=665550 RepID=UPI00029AF00D|nr:hypothetical protein [Dietzia alimentaria]